MLSNGFARPLHLRRKASLVLAGFLIVLHVLALIALLQPLAITALVHDLLYPSVVCSVVYHAVFYRHQIDKAHYWIWHAGGSWQYSDNERLFSLVLPRSVQTPWFVALTLTDTRQRQRLLIVRDQLDADTFRRLRVRVKLHQEDTAAAREEPV